MFAGGRFWVVDTGPGSWNRLALWRVDGRHIGGVLLTHFHSDHIGELGEFNMQTWVAGRERPLRVFGPPGVERVVAGFTEAYALDSGYRTAHHGADFLPPDVGRMEAVLIPVRRRGRDRRWCSTRAACGSPPSPSTTRRSRPAYGYRFDYRGRSVVVSGDTVKDADARRGGEAAPTSSCTRRRRTTWSPCCARQAQRSGRDRIAKILGDIPSYHTSPVEAAEVANAAGVKLLVLYHLTPPPTAGLVERAFVRGVDAVRPKGWVLADDGLLITLPADATTIDVGSIE